MALALATYTDQELADLRSEVEFEQTVRAVQKARSAQPELFSGEAWAPARDEAEKRQ